MDGISARGEMLLLFKGAIILHSPLLCSSVSLFFRLWGWGCSTPWCTCRFEWFASTPWKERSQPVAILVQSWLSLSSLCSVTYPTMCIRICTWLTQHESCVLTVHFLRWSVKTILEPQERNLSRRLREGDERKKEN